MLPRKLGAFSKRACSFRHRLHETPKVRSIELANVSSMSSTSSQLARFRSIDDFEMLVVRLSLRQRHVVYLSLRSPSREAKLG